MEFGCLSLRDNGTIILQDGNYAYVFYGAINGFVFLSGKYFYVRIELKIYVRSTFLKDRLNSKYVLKFFD